MGLPFATDSFFNDTLQPIRSKIIMRHPTVVLVTKHVSHDRILYIFHTRVDTKKKKKEEEERSRNMLHYYKCFK